MSEDDTAAADTAADEEAHDDHGQDDHGHGDHGHGDDGIERQTAPQGEYTMRDVGVGFGVALVGMALVFLVPFLLA